MPNSFHDVTRGTNVVKCDSTSTGCTSGEIGYQAEAGYDQATGLGSLDVSNLLNAWPDFGLSASPTALNIQRGASGTATISVSPANGFNETVTLACKVADSLTNVTCSISPAPSSSGTALLTVTAGATARSPFRGFPSFGSQSPWTGAVMLLLLGTFLLWPHRRAKLLVPASACALLLAVAVTTASCGNGSASGATTTTAALPKPPSQTGSATVTATASQSSKSVSVTVTVQ